MPDYILKDLAGGEFKFSMKKPTLNALRRKAATKAGAPPCLIKLYDGEELLSSTSNLSQIKNLLYIIEGPEEYSELDLPWSVPNDKKPGWFYLGVGMLGVVVYINSCRQLIHFIGSIQIKV